MTARCELADRCPIVEYFNEQAWQMMLKRYCYGEFGKCHRYQLRQQGATSVPVHIMPWDGDSELNDR